MRNAILQHSHNGVVRIALLTLAIFMAVPGQVIAATETCNPDLDFTILNDPPFFIDDPMRISSNIGAKQILGGNYQDISVFGFATDCKEGESFQNCSGTEAKVEFLENFTTDCTDADGNLAQFLIPEGIVPIQVVGSPIRTNADETCNVQFDMAVTQLDPNSNRIIQAMGWPVAGYAPTACDNGLTSSATSTIAFDVQTCDIEVIKEVSIDGETWFDANTEGSAPRLGPEDTAFYRLKVKNTSSVDFIGDLLVKDPNLIGGDGVSVTPSFDGNGEMIIGGSGTAFEAGQACSDVLQSGVGYFTNTASVEGICRGGEHSGGKVSAIESDIAKINCFPDDPRKSGIAVKKYTNGDDANAAPGPYIKVGDPVTWSYEVYNIGNEGVTIDSLVDDMEGTVTCDDTFLLKDEFTTCTAKMGVAVAGQYGNLATVNGTSDYTFTSLEDTDPSHYFGMVASIDLVKTPVPMIYTHVGQEIAYTFAVTNTGNVVLTNVNVTDPLPGLSTVSCPETELAANGGTMDCTATYKTTQADMDAKVVNNTATARGTPPVGSEVTDQDKATISTEPVFSLALVKTAAPATYSAAGEVITYGYLLTNDGNQTLYAPYSVVDDKATVGCPAEPASLAPGASVTCAATYSILESDLPESATSVTNKATGKALDAPEGNEVLSNEDEETVYYTGISILKEIYDGEAWLDANTPGTAPVKHWPAGALYRITVKNIGVVDLVNVTITDAELGLDGLPVNGGSLLAGQEIVLTEQEVAALNRLSVCDETGDYLNTVYGSGIAVTSQQSVNAEDVAYLSCVGTPDIEVVKYISIDDGVTWTAGTAGPVQAPSGALYKITVENTGKVDLTNVLVSDTLIPNDPFEVGELAVADGIVTITEGEWTDLNMATVCGVSGLIENVADVIGTSVEYDEDVTDTDNAFLDCIDEPMIFIQKYVSLDNGASWHDANVEPFPTAVVDDTEDTALYKLTVTNVGTVPLFNVLVNDDQLGIKDYLVGTLGVPGSVVLEKGDIPALEKVNICSITGKKTNTASAKGTSAAGVSHEWFDSATVDCIGSPAIRILKEVSDNGVTWSSTSVTTLAPADAYYRITVSNIGNVALDDVVVSDSILGISNYAVGSMAIGDTVVIAHDGTGDLLLEDLYIPGICEGADVIPNTATADGKAADSTETVHAEDEATFICEVPVDICDEFGRPLVLKMQYEGVSVVDHHQGVAGIIVPHPVNLPSDALLELYDKNELEDTVLKSAGDPFNILGAWTNSGKIPPNITIKIFAYDVIEDAVVKGALLQTITFHGSCSAPLVVGDQFGGVSIIGYTAL